MYTDDAPPFFNFTTDVVDGWARSRPDALALWCIDGRTGGEEKFTFRQIAALSSQAANVLAEQGIRRGDRVVVLLPRIQQWWVAMLGLIRLGAVPIPGTVQLSARDLAYRLETAEVRGLITNPEGTTKAQGFDGVRLCVGEPVSGWADWDAALERASANFSAPPTRSSDPGILYFTSATTGEPKMVVHSQASYGLAHKLTGQLWLDCKPNDVHWNVSDLGWAKAAWSSFFGPWHMGACIFAFDAAGKFDSTQTLNTLAHFPITTWCVPPTALRVMVREPLANWKFPHLRHCVSAGEPLNPEVLRLWKAATGHEIYEGYGQTESVVMIGALRSRGDEVRPGSMGKPVPGMPVSLVDEEGREVPAGTEGEVALRVAPKRPLGLFQEYWRNPDETARHFRGDWYLTGDRAVRDADGYYWFVGRNDDIIKSSGYRIGPFEVESVLLEHPAVLEAAVIGKADEVRGQIVKAYVVLRANTPVAADLTKELQEHCRKTTAPYKYPREIEFVKEIPKTISGKLRRVELRAKAAQKLSPLAQPGSSV